MGLGAAILLGFVFYSHAAYVVVGISPFFTNTMFIKKNVCGREAGDF